MTKIHWNLAAATLTEILNHILTDLPLELPYWHASQEGAKSNIKWWIVFFCSELCFVFLFLNWLFPLKMAPFIAASYTCVFMIVLVMVLLYRVVFFVLAFLVFLFFYPHRLLQPLPLAVLVWSSPRRTHPSPPWLWSVFYPLSTCVSSSWQKPSCQ